MTQCIDQLTLSAYAADAYDEVTAQRIAAHLRTCEKCRDRAVSLRDQRRRFLAAHPTAPAVSAESSGQPARTLPFRTRAPMQAVYALAACLALFVGVGVYLRTDVVRGSNTRVKGDVGISVFVQAANGSVESRADNVYHPGERIQFAYSCDARNRLALLCIDGKGAISTYFPASGDSSAAVESGRGLPLPNSIVLDDYLGKELYLAVFSSSPLPLATLKEQLARAYADSSDVAKVTIRLGNGAVVKTVLTTKTER